MSNWNLGNITWPYFSNRDRYGPWSSALPADLSYQMAMTYLSAMGAAAIYMCYKVPTRIRFIGLIVNFLGLSIAVVGYLRTTYVVNSNVFWTWNFTAEGTGVVILCHAIVSVGSGFYPMTENRNFLRHFSLFTVIIYGLIALANLVYYVQQRDFHHSLTGAEVQKLRDGILRVNLYAPQELAAQRAYEQSLGLIPMGDAAITGVDNWTELAWAEQDYYLRPSTVHYLTHQLIMFFTCVWACVYLFKPLIRHHKYGPVGRSIDSDAMAIAVWCMGYSIALDLCTRITICPIFFLPAPKFLVRFYRDHFQMLQTQATNSGTGGGSKGNNTTRSWNSTKKHSHAPVTADSSTQTGTLMLASHVDSDLSRIDGGDVPKRSSQKKFSSQQLDGPVPNSPGHLRPLAPRCRFPSGDSRLGLSGNYEGDNVSSQGDRADSIHEDFDDVDIQMQTFNRGTGNNQEKGSENR
ncbi:hypothetical protein BG015_011028 [Linnemannia schmuckeri]|uniref:Uncharacterized protein n=1 Tax=Linnemannia schmuckeri TaxID=64567 RepID=A0A9P5RWR1_9FUNG|nr:hypothetical protein BG015_011028 [Linnemannia schmuckeri]